MQRRFNVIQDVTGRAIAGASIYVYTSAGALATLYSDNGVTSTGNPVSTNSQGEYSYYAPDGAYSEQISAGGYVGETQPGVLLFDSTNTINATSFAGVDATGATDSTAGLQRFLNLGGRLRIPYGTYKISGVGLTGIGNTHLVIDDGTVIDFSGVTTVPSSNSPWSNTAFGLVFKGAIGNSVALTANAASQQNAIVLADVTGINPDDWLYVSSQALYETDTNTKYGEFAQVLAVNGGTKTVTFTEPLYLSYATANTAIAQKMAFAENITIEGKAEFRGAFAGTRAHGAILFWYCRNFAVKDITTNKTDYVGIQAYKCLDGVFNGITCKKDSYNGGNIGVSLVYGTSRAKVTNSSFYDLCHAVDASGDTATGGVCMDIQATNNQCFNMHGSSMNTHPGVGGFCDFSHNIIHMSVGLNSGTPTGMCGIRCQGPNLTAIGNMLFNVTGQGIQHQWETTPAVPKMTTIKGNEIYASPTNTTDYPNNTGILCQGYSGATPSAVDSVTVEGNHIYGFMSHVDVFAFNNSIGSVTVANNLGLIGTASSTNFGIRVRASTGFTVGKFAMTGNTSEVVTGTSVNFYCLGADVSSVKNGTSSGNTGLNGVNVFRFDNVDTVTERNNTAVPDGGGKKYNIGANSTNMSLDRWQGSTRTVTTSSITVNPEDDSITFNVAATCTVTLPDPTKWAARELKVKTITAQLVNSASSNVVPVAGGAAGTAILAATAGKYALLKSDGTSWITMLAN